MPEKLYFELPTDKGNAEIPENSPLNYEIEAALYKGNSDTAVIIIVGKGGTTEGYENKYVTIANNLVKDHGVNVFVIENPGISWDDPELFFDSAMKFVIDKMKEFGYDNPKFYMMGYSAGGHFTGRFSYKYPEIKKLLLVNAVLSVDFEKLKKGLLTFQGDITIVQGDKDVDFFFHPLLNQITNANIITLPGVNHIFSNEGGLEMFIGLAEKYLF